MSSMKTGVDSVGASHTSSTFSAQIC